MTTLLFLIHQIKRTRPHQLFATFVLVIWFGINTAASGQETAKIKETEAAFYQNAEKRILDLFRSKLPNPDSVTIDEPLRPTTKTIQGAEYVVTKVQVNAIDPIGGRTSEQWETVFDPKNNAIYSLTEDLYGKFLEIGAEALGAESVPVAEEKATETPPPRPNSAATPAAVSSPSGKLVLRILNALETHDYDTFLTYTIDGVTDYFGHKNATNDYIEQDMKQDARSYKWCKFVPDLSTLESSSNRESVEYDSDALDSRGKEHKARCRLEIYYQPGSPPQLERASITVLGR
jgi:hypothetical protein